MLPVSGLSGLRKLLPSWVTREVTALVALVGVALGLWLFASIADEVVEGETHVFDETVLQAFRVPGQPDEPIGPRWLEIAMLDITALGGTPILAMITIAVVGFLIVDGKRALALFVALATGSGGLASYLLKLGFERPRPDLVAHLVEVHTLSFPSGHAMGSAVTFLTLGALVMRTNSNRAIKAYVMTVAVGLTLLVGISRIYLGVHWPTDVIAGWCAGGSWALLCWLIALVLQRRGKIEQESA